MSESRSENVPAETIIVAACVITRDDGRVLTVRKRGTDAFMLPGGKPDTDETPVETVTRELSEELGLYLDPALLEEYGTVTDAAANEPGAQVTGHHFRWRGQTPDPSPAAEIEELRWVDPMVPAGTLAPMLVNHTLPMLRAEAARSQTSPSTFDPAPVRTIGSVTVFAGSGDGADPLWRRTANHLGEILGRERIEVVYGGAAVGLMGAVADSALSTGGRVTGVMPGLLIDREIGHRGLTHFERVGTMAERKQRMYELGDAFVALPGGAGTLEELFEVWTQQHIGLHEKPVALVGPDGFWQPLIDLLQSLVEAEFIRARSVESLIVVEDVADLLPALAQWASPGSKWS